MRVAIVPPGWQADVIDLRVKRHVGWQPALLSRQPLGPQPAKGLVLRCHQLAERLVLEPLRASAGQERPPIERHHAYPSLLPFDAGGEAGPGGGGAGVRSGVVSSQP